VTGESGYRLLGRSAPRLRDFLSDREKDRPRAPDGPYVDHVGVSVYDSESQALAGKPSASLGPRSEETLLAEGEEFEPSRDLTAPSGFRDERASCGAPHSNAIYVRSQTAVGQLAGQPAAEPQRGKRLRSVLDMARTRRRPRALSDADDCDRASLRSVAKSEEDQQQHDDQDQYEQTRPNADVHGAPPLGWGLERYATHAGGGKGYRGWLAYQGLDRGGLLAPGVTRSRRKVRPARDASGLG
jgi:hypothetical protein